MISNNNKHEVNKNDCIDIYYHGVLIKENCLVLDKIQDHYFKKGLLVYLYCNSKETIDLENSGGLYVKKKF